MRAVTLTHPSNGGYEPFEILDMEDQVWTAVWLRVRTPVRDTVWADRR